MRNNYLFIFVIHGLFLLIRGASGDQPCIPRKYNHESVVCICNSSYCDDISKVEKQPAGKFVLYTSDSEGLRFEKTSGSFNRKKQTPVTTNNVWIDRLLSLTKTDEVILNINRSITYQKIVGFGGAFTDAVGINYEILNDELKEKFMNSYFSDKGLEYNMGRVPISGCDFSTHPYAYNMYPENDINLSNYSLTEEDFQYKIPLIKKAQELAEEQILLKAAAWSPPPWMKSNGKITGLSYLPLKYYQTWANYHLKFLEEYDKNGISFWGISTGNEPLNGIIPFVCRFNSLGWGPDDHAKWIAENFGPTIRKSKFKDINIFALDDQRFILPGWLERLNETKNTMNYIDGIAIHWYWNDMVPVKIMNTVHDLFPDKFLLSSEACVGDKPWQFEKVELGSWRRGEKYIKDIIEDLNHWYVGWLDWNMILDRQGGPNWADNFVDSPIIMLSKDEFAKQPLYYAIGHFSKFIPRGSVRVQVDRSPEIKKFEEVAFLRPDGGITVVLYNPTSTPQRITVQEKGKGHTIIDLKAKSVSTLVYW